MRVNITLTVPDHFEPFTTCCENDCPFGYYDEEDGSYRCNYGTEDGCPMMNYKEVDK